jgi:ankyrin repeat protein
MTASPFNTAAAPGANARLLAAVEAQDMKAVQDALKEGADADTVDRNGDPVLFAALEKNNKIIPYVLLCAGADAVLPDRKYDDLLMQTAVSSGLTAAFGQLLAAGVNLKTQGNEPLLHKAVQGGHVEMAKRLLDEGVDVNEMGVRGSALRAAMGAAVSHDNEDCVQALLEAGADPMLESYDHSHGGIISDLEHAKDRPPIIRNMVETAARRFEFFAALAARDSRKVSEMLDKGLPPDVRNPAGDTALIQAAQDGFDDGVAALLAKGAQKELTGRGGNTPLHAAATGPSVGVAQRLIEAGASAALRNAAGQTPLQSAAQSARADPAVLLAIRRQYDKEMQAAVDKALQVKAPVKPMQKLRIKPRGT